MVYFRGILTAIRDWFRDYKIPDGKPANKFGLGNKAANKVILQWPFQLLSVNPFLLLYWFCSFFFFFSILWSVSFFFFPLFIPLSIQSPAFDGTLA